MTDGRPLSDLIELDEHTRKCLAFEATLTDRQIDMFGVDFGAFVPLYAR